MVAGRPKRKEGEEWSFGDRDAHARTMPRPIDVVVDGARFRVITGKKPRDKLSVELAWLIGEPRPLVPGLCQRLQRSLEEATGQRVCQVYSDRLDLGGTE